jgi:hypothetical protein
MHFKQASQPQTVRITRQLAEQHAALPNIGLDRKLNPYRVERYVKDIKEGTMRPVLWARARCLEDNAMYRVNGQHTSHAYVSVDCIPDHSYAIVEEYICDTRDDLPRLWQTFDNKACARTTMEVMAAYRGADSTLADVSLRAMNIAIKAIDMVSRGGAHSAGMANLFVNPIADRIEAGLQHRDFIVWVHRLLSEKEHPHMLRVGLCASMFATWSKCQRDCRQFWLEVRDESDANTQSATRRLSKWLMQHYARRHGGGAASREEYARGVLWWNAYRTGSSTDIRYTIGSKIPTVA